MTEMRQYLKTLLPAVAKRYKEKLQLYCDNIDPLNLDTSSCSRDPQDLPDITTHHILSYLMLTKCPYTGQKKAQKALQLENGTVLQICVQKFDAISIVLGEILLETGEYLKPWFVCFPLGYILCAHCTLCQIDETCSHIELLLYSVNKVKVNEGMLDDSNVSSTNQIDTIDLTDTEQQQVEQPSRLYVCGICGDQFENKEDFKEHCTVMHQLVPAEPQTVRRKRKNRNGGDDNAFVCASNSQIQIVNAESLGMMYHDSDMSAPPEYVDAEHILCDDSQVEYGPIVIYQNELINDDGTGVVNVDHQSSELIVIEDEDD